MISVDDRGANEWMNGWTNVMKTKFERWWKMLRQNVNPRKKIFKSGELGRSTDRPIILRRDQKISVNFFRPKLLKIHG